MAEKNKLKITALAKGILFSIILSLILILIITFVCYWGNISEKLLGFMLFLASGISVFISSLFMAKKMKHKGFIYGTLNGILYFILITLLSVCFSGNFSLSTHVLTTLLGTVLAGALGGVIGVNR